MSEEAKFVCFLTFVAFIGMGVYPPWIAEATSVPISNRQIDRLPLFVADNRPAGYGWLFDPPSGVSKIDLTRLSLQWFMLGTVTAAICWVSRKSQASQAKTAEQTQPAVCANGSQAGRVVAEHPLPGPAVVKNPSSLRVDTPGNP
jgi:hypothetical protein